jgi:hypothetical protein
VRPADLRATHLLVTGVVEQELRRESLPPATFGSLRSQELILAKTAGRSLLGCMNDMAFRCEVAISDAGGLAHVDLGDPQPGGRAAKMFPAGSEQGPRRRSRHPQARAKEKTLSPPVASAAKGPVAGTDVAAQADQAGKG